MNRARPVFNSTALRSALGLRCSVGAGCLVLLSTVAKCAEPAVAAKEVLSRHCYECHGGAKTKGGVDLKRLAADPKVTEDFGLWEKVRDSVASGDMPPPNAKPLAAADKQALVTWTTAALDAAAAAKSGDPGPVTMRRLSNAEYDYTLRDLTGRDYRLAKEFQADSGGGEGFSNTGDVLFLSPAALDSYFNAARKVADHATIMPGTGIIFHEHRIGLRGPEQVKAQAVEGINLWYQQQAAAHLPKDLEDAREVDYLVACWKHRHFKEPIAELARTAGLIRPFLENWWRLVNSTEPRSRFLDLTRVAWRELPGPDAAHPGTVPLTVREGARSIREQLLAWNSSAPTGSSVGRWLQDASRDQAHRLTADVVGKSNAFLCLGDTGDGHRGDIALITGLQLQTTRGPIQYLDWLEAQLASDRAAKAADPQEARLIQQRIAAGVRVQSALGKHSQGRAALSNMLVLAAPQILSLPLPRNAVRLTAEARIDLKQPEARHATLQLVLDAERPREVTKVMPGVAILWLRQPEAAGRTMAEFMELRAAFPESFERRLEKVAANLRRGAPAQGVYYLSDEQLGELVGVAGRDMLQKMRLDLSLVAGAPGSQPPVQQRWDQLVLGHLREFASHAWRRPLDHSEAKELETLYLAGLASELDRESAAREVLVRVLVSPHFLFRAETLPAVGRTTPDEVALSAWEVAARLSYFLWASLPDMELRRVVQSGALLQPSVLLQQVDRMLRDPRAAALAWEFAGQWLQFTRFEEQVAVDGKVFPEFSPELSRDMQQEAIEFFTHLVREDRSVADIWGGDYSFINDRLAGHYGVSGSVGAQFLEVKMTQYHRGGLLGMGAILTKTSRPQRTSPVLRGDYLHQVLLGFSVPPPPAEVPKLDEQGLRPATLREHLRQHRADQACAACHDRLDPLGFALENFDAIGRFRTADSTGELIDATGELRDGTRLQGIEGLRGFLRHSEAQLTAQFCRKLLGYALGRQTRPSDRALLLAMQQALKQKRGRVSAAVGEVVTSRQFLHRRNEVAKVPQIP